MTTSRKTPKNPAVPASPDADSLLSLLRKANKPLRLDDILRITRWPRKVKRKLELILGDLVEAGSLVRLTGGGYAAADTLRSVEGVLHVQRSGVGFVSQENDDKGDIFIAPYQMGQAWHGDRVRVAILPGKGGKSREGKITEVVERGRSLLPARVMRGAEDERLLCEAADPRIEALFLVDVSGLDSPPQRDDLVLIRPGDSPRPGVWNAVAEADLGGEFTAPAQELVVKAAHNVPTFFPADVLAEADALPEAPDPADLAGREDCSHLDFVTIDGPTARDFDDAVYVEEDKDGYRLWVAIADVAHYVRHASLLDREALSRGNSYYFPASVEPMFPERLSNGLCSLNPRVPRLVMVAEMRISRRGEALDSRFYAAHIVSKARLTYEQVQAALFDGDKAEREALGSLLPMLDAAGRLARIMADARDARGTLDFDTPEAKFDINDQGQVIGVSARSSTFSNRLIEEFMVAANEAVARFLTDRGIPFLYRAHPAPDPDKLEGLFSLLGRTGLAASLPKNPTVRDLQHLLSQTQGTDQEYMINRLALRSMMQARYTPEHEGHFGLASASYCHFTSPIRRYADLVVHRALKSTLASPDKDRVASAQQLQGVADHINATERSALEAERETTRRMAALFMRDKVGETFSGTVSGVTEYGFFVECLDGLIEGMVPLASMRDDFYVLIQDRQELRGERSGKRILLGDPITVRLAEVNLARQEITFESPDSLPDSKRSRPRGNARNTKAKAGAAARKPRPARPATTKRPRKPKGATSGRKKK